jgi:hypothetical protein
LIRITHRDEVEAPITDWLQEAYELSDELSKPDEPKLTPAAQKQPAAGKREDVRQPTEIPRKAGPASKRAQEKQLARVRRICFSMPGTNEELSHGEPTFFSPKRVFAMFAGDHHGDGRIAVWLPAAPGVQADLIQESPDTYFRPPYLGARGTVQRVGLLMDRRPRDCSRLVLLCYKLLSDWGLCMGAATLEK